MKKLLPLLLLAGCVSAPPGMLDPAAVGPSMTAIATEYKEYVAADQTLTEINRAAKIHEADMILETVAVATAARNEEPATPSEE